MEARRVVILVPGLGLGTHMHSCSAALEAKLQGMRSQAEPGNEAK